jgi:hypothetical protein
VGNFIATRHLGDGRNCKSWDWTDGLNWMDGRTAPGWNVGIGP